MMWPSTDVMYGINSLTIILIILSLSCVFDQCQTLLNHTVNDTSTDQPSSSDRPYTDDGPATTEKRVRTEEEKRRLLFGKNPTLKCGVQLNVTHAPSTRVIGGRDAVFGEFPWFSAIILQNKWKPDLQPIYKCGGVIIGSYWVLTAAHCFNEKDSERDAYIVAGTTRLTFNEHRAQSYSQPVLNTIIHPYYSPDKGNAYDIALLRTLYQIPMQGFKFAISPVCLPDNAEEPSQSIGIFTGFGATEPEPDQRPSKTMKVAQLPLFNFDECLRIAEGREFTKTMLCGGFREPQAGPCLRDSGGPLVQFVNDRGIVIGVMSALYGDCGTYSGYTKVSSYIDWIFDTIEEVDPIINFN